MVKITFREYGCWGETVVALCLDYRCHFHLLCLPSAQKMMKFLLTIGCYQLTSFSAVIQLSTDTWLPVDASSTISRWSAVDSNTDSLLSFAN